MGKYLAVLCLSLIVVSPSIVLPSLIQVKPSIENVKTINSLKKTIAFGQAFESKELIRIEEYTDGSEKFHISEYIMLNDPSCQGVYVNCTIWYNPTLQSSRSEQAYKSAPAISSSGLYPYFDIIDGLHFLLKGNNGTHLVSYNHDNNYDSRGYHPGEWYWSGSLPGILMQHIHLPTDVITDWYNGVVDSATLWTTIFAILGGGTTIVGGVVTVLGCPPIGALAIIGGLAAILGAIVNYVYKMQLANWIRDVVTEKFSGDGWSWMGAVLSCIAVVTTNLGGLSPGGDFIRFGKVDDYYEIRNWQQSWGAEGIFPGSTQDYLVAWRSKRECKLVNAVGR
jgi:hypothetical protein